MVGSVARALTVAVALLMAALPASASNEVVLHEPIPPDPAEDLALRVALTGDLPAAIKTPGGVVGAPDPLRPPTPWDASYGMAGTHDAFTPDTDTRRPEVSDYDDPFTPSTAPFKRLDAFDAVLSDYHVEVRDPRLVRLAALQGGVPPGAEEDAFYADLVVDLPPEGSVRIPSVGPGARVVRARLGIGETGVPFQILRDGADNWFLEPIAPPSPRAIGASALPKRARLVMEVAIARAAFGGALSDVGWSELPFVAPLPDNVARDATRVRAVDRGEPGDAPARRRRQAGRLLPGIHRLGRSPCAARKRLPRPGPFEEGRLQASRVRVPHHRAEPRNPHAARRERGARVGRDPRREVLEAHRPRRGRPLAAICGASNRAARSVSSAARTVPVAAARRARERHGLRRRPGRPDGRVKRRERLAPAVSRRPAWQRRPSPDLHDLACAITDAVVHRGVPLHVHGAVRADGEACAHVAVELSLREPSGDKRTPLGTLATGDDGAFDGAVVPSGLPLGDYELFAETRGDARCGRGAN